MKEAGSYWILGRGLGGLGEAWESLKGQGGPEGERARLRELGGSLGGPEQAVWELPNPLPLSLQCCQCDDCSVHKGWVE